MATSEISYPNSYNRELILDLTLEAFSVYEMDHEGSPRIHDYIPLPGYVLSFSNEPVLDNTGATVVDVGGATVTVNVSSTANRTTDPRKENFKFLATMDNLVSIAEYRDYGFLDWVSVDSVGKNFDSYLVTGYDLSGDMARKKYAIYLQIYCDRTETVYTLDTDNVTVVLARQSSCKVQAQWDWNTSAAQGKWGIEFQAYRFLLPQPVAPAAADLFDYGERVIVTKNKLRGSGKALSLYIHSDQGKDLKLIGWNLLKTINGEP